MVLLSISTSTFSVSSKSSNKHLFSSLQTSLILLKNSCKILSSQIIMPAAVPTVKLNNGNEIPRLGLGTWKSTPGEVVQAVKDAIDAGYRHIDGALIYQNEAEVGEAIRAKIAEGVIKRKDIFLTSKLWNTFHRPDLVKVACQKSLKDLGLDYLDLYLIHFPAAWKEDGELEPKDENGKILESDVDFVETWKAMEKLVEEGLVKSIGVSNFNSQQINRLLSNATIVPVTNQVECHPYLNQKELVEFCKSKNIMVTAYSPFGSPDRPWAVASDTKILEDPRLHELGKKYGKTPAQVVLRWLVQRELVVIPKSVRKDRIAENFKIFDFELSTDDMEVIYGMHCNWRVIEVPQLKDQKEYPFNIKF